MCIPREVGVVSDDVAVADDAVGLGHFLRDCRGDCSQRDVFPLYLEGLLEQGDTIATRRSGNAEGLKGECVGVLTLVVAARLKTPLCTHHCHQLRSSHHSP